MLRISSRYVILLLCAITFGATLLLATTSPSHAQYLETVSVVDGDQFCPDNQDGISGRIVMCMRMVIMTAANNFLQNFLPYYEVILVASLVLSTTVYGALMLSGAVEKPTGQTFFFLFKLAGVAFFGIQIANWIGPIFNLMDGMLLLVTNYATVSTISTCGDPNFVREIMPTRVTPNVWDQMDCIFITLMGIGAVGAAPLGIVAILAPLLFASGIGFIIFFMIVSFLLSLLMSVLRAIKIYLMSLIVVAFLICVAPIILPLIMFNHTRPIFDNWLKFLMSYLLVPVFLFAFLAMMIAGFDALIFRGTSSLYYAIAGPASQPNGSGNVFSFSNWANYGISGEPRLDSEGSVEYDSNGEIILQNGEIVGRNIPNEIAMNLIIQIQDCQDFAGASPDDPTRQAMEDMCTIADDDWNNSANEAALINMIECASNPVIANEKVVELEDGEDCSDIEGHRAYGFIQAEEIMHYNIAPNTETDAAKRAKEDQSCSGWDLLCHGKKLVGAAVDFNRMILGKGLQIMGSAAQFLGNLGKAAGSLSEGFCNVTRMPGVFCAGPKTVFNVFGKVEHAYGTGLKFGGKVVSDGIAAALADTVQSKFDVESLDLVRMANYRCMYDPGSGVTPSTPVHDAAWLNCPTSADVIIEILYILATLFIFVYLMLKWLSYVPELAKTMTNTVSVDTSLPGETAIREGLKSIFDKGKSGIEKASKAKSKEGPPRGGVG